VVQLMVGWVGEEAAAECLDRLLDALAQSVERAGAVLAGGAGPALEPAVLRALGLDPRLVADEPQQHEVGVDLAGEHRLEVELEVRLAGERDAVAQHAKHEPVGDDPPQPLGRAVEQFLHEAVGALPSGALDTRAAGVDRHAAADEVDRRVLPLSEDRVGLAFDLDRRLLDEAAVAELVEQDVQAALAGQARASLAGRKVVAGLVESGPGAGQPRPRAGDRFAEALARGEVVIAGSQTVEASVAVGDPLEQVGGEQAALGVGGLEEIAGAESHNGYLSAAGSRT
jgi:hypothetical protein